MRYLSHAEADWIEEAVVKIEHGGGTGTGFFVGPGVIATCAHVLDAAVTESPVVTWRGKPLEVSGITRSDEPGAPDLAVVEVKAADHPVLPLVSEHPDLGTDVYSFGFQYTDRGYSGYPSWGLLAGVAVDVRDAEPQDLLVILRAKVAPGASGAPLFSLAAGGVVGVVKRENPDGGGYAVAAKDLARVRPGLLEENRQAAPAVRLAQRSLESYVTALGREHSDVTLVDLDRSLKLDAVYVSLTLAAKTVTGAQIEMDAAGGLAAGDAASLTKLGPWRDLGEPAQHYAQPGVPLEQLLAQQTAIVLGEPGIGKTTLLRHILARTCQGELFPTRVPVFIRLPQVKPEAGGLAEFVAAGYPAHAPAIAAAHDEGRCVYLLDGLDEVDRAHHQLLESEIQRVAAHGNHVYVTCRTAAFPRGLFSSAFRTYECVGFNWYQQRRFLAQWFSTRPDVAVRVGRELRDNADVGEFGRNPLLLSMLAVLTESDPEFRLPPRRVELYERALRLLLQRRAHAHPEVTRRAKSALLETLAFSMMVEGAETVLEDDLLEWLDGYRRDAASTALKDVESERVLEVLIDDGVLAQAGALGVRFLHRTFQEYLAARYLSRRDDWATVATRRRRDPRWAEALRLLGGMLDHGDADRLVGLLQAEGDGDEVSELDRLVLAARCAADAPLVSPGVLDDLVPPLLTYAFDHQLEPEVVDGVAALSVLCRGQAYAYDVASSAVRGQLAGGATARDLSRVIRWLGLIGNERSTAELMGLAEQIDAGTDASDEALLLFGSAVLAMGRSSEPHAIDFVAARLGSDSSYVAAMAAMALLDVPSPKLADQLQLAPTADDMHRTLAASLSFAALPSDPLRELARQTFASAPRRLEQLVARQALDPPALEPDAPFVEELLGSCSGDLDEAALVSIPSLIAYVDHEALLEAVVFDGARDLALRCAAVDALLRLNLHRAADIANRLLTSGPPDLCRAALATLASTGSDAAHPVLASRFGPDCERWLLDAVLRLFTAVPSQATEDCLLRFLADAGDIPELRLRVVRALAGTGSAAAQPHLASYLGDAAASLRERCVAYGALGLLRTPEAAEIVLAHLPEERALHAIGRGIEALGRLGGEPAEAFLLTVLDSGRWPSGWPPRQAPVQQGDQRPSDQRCLAAVIALNRLGSTAALGELDRLTLDEGEAPEVRQAAFIAARTIAWNASTPTGVSAAGGLLGASPGQAASGPGRSTVGS